MHLLYLVENIDIAGGIERSLTTRVNYLIEKYNYQITIICTQKKSGIPYYNLNKKATIIFLDPINSKNSVLGRILLRFKQSKYILNDLNPDIIISVKYFLHNLFFQILKKKHLLISEIREPKEQYNYNIITIKQKIYVLFRNLVFRRQDLIIVLTEADKKSWGFKNCTVVPNPKTIETNIVSNLMIKQVLALGRLDKIKGFDKLIDCWKILSEKYPDWKLRICGAGIEFEHLRQKIFELNLSFHVELTNEFKPVIPEFLNSSIFVLTSQFEAFGNVLVEAKVCGVPSVAFDAPNGPKEIIIDNVDGFIVELNNVESLAKKISVLIEDQNLRKEMGRMARINSERYNIDRIMKIYHCSLISIIK